MLNNQDLNQVTWEQRVMEGDPKFEASQEIPDVPYHQFAELIGLKGIYVDDAERMGAAWDEAFAADRPVVIEVKTDPNVPPLPPHITLAQAKAFASTLMKGDPDEGNVIVNTAKQVLSSVFPGHHSSLPVHGEKGQYGSRRQPSACRSIGLRRKNSGLGGQCRGRRYREDGHHVIYFFRSKTTDRARTGFAVFLRRVCPMG